MEFSYHEIANVLHLIQLHIILCCLNTKRILNTLIIIICLFPPNPYSIYSVIILLTFNNVNSYILWNNTYSFFCKFKNVIESPKPVKASSAMNDMLLALRSKCLSLCKRRSESLGIECKLLSPNLKYWRFSKGIKKR